MVLEKVVITSLILEGFFGLLEGGGLTTPLRMHRTSSFSVYLGSGSCVMGISRGTW